MLCRVNRGTMSDIQIFNTIRFIFSEYNPQFKCHPLICFFPYACHKQFILLIIPNLKGTRLKSYDSNLNQSVISFRLRALLSWLSLFSNPSISQSELIHPVSMAGSPLHLRLLLPESDQFPRTRALIRSTKRWISNRTGDQLLSRALIFSS